MSLNAQLLNQILTSPEAQDVTQLPTMQDVLRDPANAADVVTGLASDDPLKVRNARKVLCEFDYRAAPWLLANANTADVAVRRQLLDVLWAILTTESTATVHDSLKQVKPKLNMLLDDRSLLPEHAPDYIERDFSGRLCDLAYIVIKQLLSTTFDQSLFRAMDNEDRDSAITTLKKSDLSPANEERPPVP